MVLSFGTEIETNDPFIHLAHLGEVCKWTFVLHSICEHFYYMLKQTLYSPSDTQSYHHVSVQSLSSMACVIIWCSEVLRASPM